MKFSLLIAGMLLVGSFARAGREGNGGDVVDCPDKTVLLDVYEIRFRSNVPLLTEKASGNYQQKLEYLFEQFRPNATPYWIQKYRDQLQELMAHTEWVETELEDIPDSQHLVFPVGCKVRQLAIQYRQNGHSRLQINRPLWEKLDEDNKVGLLRHEAIYAEAIDADQPNSIPTRAMNSHLLVAGTYNLANDQIKYGFPFQMTLPSHEVVLYPAHNPQHVFENIADSWYPSFPREPRDYELSEVCG